MIRDWVGPGPRRMNDPAAPHAGGGGRHRRPLAVRRPLRPPLLPAGPRPPHARGGPRQPAVPDRRLPGRAGEDPRPQRQGPGGQPGIDRHHDRPAALRGDPHRCRAPGPAGPAGPARSTRPACRSRSSDIQARLVDKRYDLFKPVPIAEDVSPELEIYLLERADQFPSVDAMRTSCGATRGSGGLPHPRLRRRAQRRGARGQGGRGEGATTPATRSARPASSASSRTTCGARPASA